MNETPTMQQQQQQPPQQHHHYHVNHPEAVYFVHSTYQSPELFMSQDTSQSSGSGDTLKFVSNSPEMDDEPLEKPRTGQYDDNGLVNRYHHHQHQQQRMMAPKMSPPGLVLLNKTANTHLPVVARKPQPPPPLMAINDEIIISENRKQQPPLLPNPNRMASYVDDCSEYLEFSASSCSASSSLFMPHSSFSQQAGSTKKPSSSNNNTSAYVNKNLSSYIDHGSYFSPMSMSMSDRSNNSSSSCCMSSGNSSSRMTSSSSSSSSAHHKRAVNRNLNVTNFGGVPIADMSSTNAASFLTSDAAAAVEQQPLKNPLLRNPKLSHLKTNNTSTPSNSKFIYPGFAPYMPVDAASASLAAPSCDLIDATQAARDQFLKIDEEDEELRIQMIPGERYN